MPITELAGRFVRYWQDCSGVRSISVDLALLIYYLLDQSAICTLAVLRRSFNIETGLWHGDKHTNVLPRIVVRNKIPHPKGWKQKHAERSGNGTSERYGNCTRS
jgi:hypothetical protein